MASAKLEITEIEPNMASAKLEITGIEPNQHHYFSQKHALLCLELQHRHEIDKKKQNFIQII